MVIILLKIWENKSLVGKALVFFQFLFESKAGGLEFCHLYFLTAQ